MAFEAEDYSICAHTVDFEPGVDEELLGRVSGREPHSGRPEECLKGFPATRTGPGKAHVEEESARSTHTAHFGCCRGLVPNLVEGAADHHTIT